MPPQFVEEVFEKNHMILSLLPFHGFGWY